MIDFERALPNFLHPLHHGLPEIAESTATPQGRPAGDVLQIPPWPCLLRLQLPAKTIKQPTELEEEQLQL